MVVRDWDLVLNEFLSRSCQSLSIFKWFWAGADPTSRERNIGRALTTLFLTLSGLLALIT